MSIARIGSTEGWSKDFTVGTSAVEPNRLVYLAADVVQHARGNAATTARGIAGVTVGRAVSGAFALVKRTGLARIAVDSVTPTSGLLFQPAYLSSEDGGLATSVITGLTYPRLLGWFSEDEVASDGTAQLALDLNELRDDATEWLLETWAPVANSQKKNFSIAPSLFSELRIVGRDLRVSPAGMGTNYYLLIDDATPDSYYASISTVLFTHDTGGAKMKLIASHSTNPHEQLDCRMLLNGTIMSVASMGGWTYTPMRSHTYYAVPTTSIGVGAIDALSQPTTEGFQANVSTLKLYGRVL